MKFSVLICTYNYGHLLPDALRTLAAQTVPDFELLVVDDGSTDNTEEVVRRFSPQFCKCIYLKKPHTGPSESRKVAVEAATGTHIAFMDADDFWSPQYLDTMQKAFEEHSDADLAISNGIYVQDSGTVTRLVFRAGSPLPEHLRSPQELFWLCVNFFPTGMVFLKSLYERVGPFDLRYGFGPGEDTDWAVRAVISGAHCIRLPQKLFLHRVHGSNLTTNPIAFWGPWLRIYTGQIKGSPLGPEFERYARQFSRGYVIRLLGISSPSEGRRLLRQALQALPGDGIIICAYLSTYLGSTSVLKILKWGKKLIREKFRAARRIDLSGSPEKMFENA
jgi:glycosyltransferase involved in cell wall biosynthesis